MEEKLEEIAENTRSKSSFLVTLSGTGASIEKSFEPEIAIKPGCHYEIAFTSLETYYSMPNIDDSNNDLAIVKDGVLTHIKIDTGCYGLMDLNTEIQRQLKKNGMTNAVEFKANYNTLKCIMIIQPGYTVCFHEHSLRKILGFELADYSAKKEIERYESPHTVQILSVNSILVHCDLVGGSYLNGSKASVLHSFFPMVNPGEKIVERPVEYIYTYQSNQTSFDR